MLLGTLDVTPKFPNIPVSLQGNTEVPGQRHGPRTPGENLDDFLLADSSSLETNYLFRF